MAANKILMVQNAEHVEAMRKYAIDELYKEFHGYTDENGVVIHDGCRTQEEVDRVCKQARDCGLYEVADDIADQWQVGKENYKLEVIENRMSWVGWIWFKWYGI